MPYKSIDSIELKFDHGSKTYTLGIRNITVQPSITGANLPAGTFYLRQGKKEIAVAWNYTIYKPQILQALKTQQSEVPEATLDTLVEMLIKTF